MVLSDARLRPVADEDVGTFCHELAQEPFPICRSLTGPGVRETLARLGKRLPGLVVHEVASGTQAFDWVVPDEWTIRDGYIADESGQRVVDFKTHNLHVVGYSGPIERWMELEELDKRLHSLPDQPDAIPYVTSYYAKYWGFCLTHRQRKSLKPGRYRVVIDADLKPGVLNYADLVIAGQSDKEVLLSTYVCHPSMANNELSGPVVATALARWLMSLEERHYTYRIVFIPETIGSIVYLSRNLEHLKKHIIAGFNISCIGDDRCYSYLPSRAGDTLSDRAARHVLRYLDPAFKRYTWLDRGSDERQYCAPGVDLPIATITRSKYGEYPEYHTSLDDLALVTPRGLEGGFNALRQAIEVIENDVSVKTTVFCEPQLGKRGLYATLDTEDPDGKVWPMLNLLTYCDGNHTLLQIAEKIDEPVPKLIRILKPLLASGLVEATRDYSLYQRRA